MNTFYNSGEAENFNKIFINDFSEGFIITEIK